MKTRFMVSLFVLLMCSHSDVANADSIWFVGEKVPAYGIVESADANTIRFRRTADGKKYELVSIDRKSVESIAINFDSKRLEALVPGAWQSWYEYAEELTSQSRDPVARHLAMRLLVIVAGNSTDANQRDAALADLISLSRNVDESKKLKQLRFLESGIRQASEQEVLASKTLHSTDRLAAIKLVQAIRNDREVVEPTLDAQIKKTIEAFSDVCSWQELVQISKSNRIGDQQLRQLVALEFRLRIGNAAQTKNESSKESWHLLASRGGKSSIVLPTIENVTEFDPGQTRFVNGKWSQR